MEIVIAQAVVMTSVDQMSVGREDADPSFLFKNPSLQRSWPLILLWQAIPRLLLHHLQRQFLGEKELVQG